ncbi:MAG: hypothetical protein HY332_12815 [Chloroflexi bacterium]|nr:hypothetical protein [Chloroflexota bacterium]
MAARPDVADTSVLIPYFRVGAYDATVEDRLGDGRLYLASPVALELYAGTRDQAEKRALDAFVGSFQRRGLLLTPTHDDHILAGILLSRRRRLQGDLHVRDHLMDVLIILSAAQIGGTVLTTN